MVPYREHDVPESLPSQLRGEEAEQEVPFLLRRVSAGFPALDGVRLILHRHGEDAVSAPSVLQRVPAHIPGPASAVFGAQLSAAGALRAVLHIRRGRPGREHQLEPRTGPDYVVQHGEDVLARALKRKALKRRVILQRVRAVGLRRKVAAVDMAPGQRIAQPLLPVAGPDDFGPELGGQSGVHIRRGVGDGSAEAEEGLKAFLRIQVEDEFLPVRGVRMKRGAANRGAARRPAGCGHYFHSSNTSI